EHHRGQKMWTERVSITVNGHEQVLASMWEGEPLWLRSVLAITRAIGSKPFAPLFDAMRADGHDTLEADCQLEALVEPRPQLAAHSAAAEAALNGRRTSHANTEIRRAPDWRRTADVRRRGNRHQSQRFGRRRQAADRRGGGRQVRRGEVPEADAGTVRPAGAAERDAGDPVGHDDVSRGPSSRRFYRGGV